MEKIEHPWKLEAMRRLEAIGKHVCTHDEREGGCPVCNDILQLEQTLSLDDEAATLTVGISGASAAMQAGGMPRRGQIESDAASSAVDITPVVLSPLESLGTMIARKTKELEDLGICQFGYVTDPDSLARVMAEVMARREKQDAEHGGPNHDDTHYYYDWWSFIGKFQERAYEAGMNSQWEAYEDAMLDIAALAVAAIQSSRRINHHGRD